MKTILILALAACLSACAVAGKGVGTTSLAIENVADAVRMACGNTVPGGPCTEGAIITTDEKEGIKNSLQIAVNYLAVADQAIVTGNGEQAAARLRQAEAILEAINRLLAERSRK